MREFKKKEHGKKLQNQKLSCCGKQKHCFACVHECACIFP